MIINLKYLALAIPAIIVGCGGSSGGGASSNDDGSDFFLEDLDSTDTVPVEIQENVPVEEDEDPFAIRPTDVYDPSNIFDESVCSSPYHELVGGVYTGTLALVTDSSFGSVNCTWDVELILKRSYPGVRFDCEVRMEYTATPIETSPIIVDIGNSVGEPEEEEDIELDCFEGTVIGDGERVVLSGLTDLVFPLETNVQFRNEVSGADAFGNILFAFPDGKGTRGVEFTFRGLDLSLDGSGGLSFPDVLLVNSPWTANITKTGSDIDR